ncbi:hypothetical protein [Shewanella xiamenensis]|uniref:hypothetical protein n=1 Tax=Shewanella xiamenensis TaxID=332186 RepID=UPI0021BED382|nr:hypothetical protein [Shewanella xiamenensis]MCT8865416.1 hypothetical protein [Shewanella xiamenensis]
MNVCENCDDKPLQLSFLVADTGKCSVCGNTAECWDKELIGMYHALGLSDEQIWESLPRLRNTFGELSKTLSLAEIGQKIADVLNSDKSLSERYERVYNALDYIYESGELSSRHAVEKAKWGLGMDVDNEVEVAALTARFSDR